MFEILFKKNLDLIVYVAEEEYYHEMFNQNQSIRNAKEKLRKFKQSNGVNCQSSPITYVEQINKLEEEYDQSFIDFIICIGGDGTLLHASSIFQVIFYDISLDLSCFSIDLLITLSA